MTELSDVGDTACMTLCQAWRLLELQERAEHMEWIEGIAADLRDIYSGAATVH